MMMASKMHPSQNAMKTAQLIKMATHALVVPSLVKIPEFQFEETRLLWTASNVKMATAWTTMGERIAKLIRATVEQAYQVFAQMAAEMDFELEAKFEMTVLITLTFIVNLIDLGQSVAIYAMEDLPQLKMFELKYEVTEL